MSFQGYGIDPLLQSSVRLGVLAPLSRPGWIDAGNALIAGASLAVAHANRTGGISGQPLELIVRDTAADPAKAEAAVAELSALGAAAIVGEYHSVAAQGAAACSEKLRIPFLCSSAVIDELMKAPARWVARLSPPQSRGWAFYAEQMLGRGRRRVAIAMQRSVYWNAGVDILRDALARHNIEPFEIDLSGAIPSATCDTLAGHDPDLLILLAGHPDPIVDLVAAIRNDSRLADLTIGAPAGQPELTDWVTTDGDLSVAIPFLRYMPSCLTPLGMEVAAELERDAPASFVALEGYDSVLAASFAVSRSNRRPEDGCGFWENLDVPATRGHIRFSPPMGKGVWQWKEAPLQLAERDRKYPGGIRVLASD